MSTAVTSNCCRIHGDTGSRTGHNFSLRTSVFTLAFPFLLFYSNHVSLYLFACDAILLYSDCFHIVCVSSFFRKNSVHWHINFTACFCIESGGKSVPACVRRCIYNLEQFAGAYWMPSTLWYILWVLDVHFFNILGSLFIYFLCCLSNNAATTRRRNTYI